MANITSKLGVNQWGQYYDFNKFDDKTFKDNIDYDFSMINQLPINWVRMGMIYYDNLVLNDGSYNFSRLDYAVSKAELMGLKIIMPIWFVDDGLSDKGHIHYDDMLIKYKQMIVALIKHFEGHGITYEAIDEATGGDHYWLNQNAKIRMNDIVMMHQFFKDQVHFLDGTADFLAGDYPWIGASGMMDRFQTSVNQGMLDNIKSVSFHPYISGPPEQLLTDGQLQKELKVLKNNSKNVSATEFGYAYPGSFNGSYTREQQTNYTLREIFLLDYLGIDKIIYFTMDNSDRVWSLQKSIDQSNIFDTEENWNPLGSTLRDVFLKLYGYSFSERINVGNTNDYLLRYVCEGQSDIIVGWTASNTHSVTNQGISFVLNETPQLFSNSVDNKSLSELIPITEIPKDVTFFDSVDPINNNCQNIIKNINNIGSYLTSNFGIASGSFIPPVIDSNLDRRFYSQEKFTFQYLTDSLNSLIYIFNEYYWLFKDNGSRYALIEVPELNLTFNSDTLSSINGFFELCDTRLKELVSTLKRIQINEEGKI